MGSSQVTSSSVLMAGDGSRLSPQPQRPTTAPTPTRLPVTIRLALTQETPPGTRTAPPSPRSQLTLRARHTQITHMSPMVSMARSTPLDELIDVNKLQILVE